MTTVKFGILLAIKLYPPEKEHFKSKKGKKEKKSKSSKASKKSKSSKNSVKEPALQPDYVYEAGKPAGYFHIEYSLFPNTPVYKIDVVHWKTISKIFTKDGIVTYRNYINDSKIYIPIMIQHYIDEMNIEQLRALQSYSFEVLISSNKSKLSDSAKNEKTKQFFTKTTQTEKTAFYPAYDHYPEDNEENITAGMVDGYSQIFTFDKDFLYPRMLKLIKKINYGYELYCKEFIQTAEAADGDKEFVDPDDANNIQWKSTKQPKSKSKGSKKNIKKEKKAKKKKEGKIKVTDSRIKIAAESYFTDPNNCLYFLKEPSSTLENAFVIMRVTNLLSDEAKYILQPLTIKLKFVKRLPVVELLKERFTAIQVKYNIPCIAKATSLEKPLAERIIINESHVFFYVNREKLIEFLQSQQFCVELVGIRSAQVTKPSIFGTECADHDVQYKVNPDDVLDEILPTMVLAVARFDLSVLLKPVYVLEFVNGFKHPDSLLCQNADSMQDHVKFTNTLTTNEINLKTLKKHPQSKLWDGILMQHATSMMIQVVIATPIFGLTKMLGNAGYYKRMYLVVYKSDVAIVLLKEMLAQNESYAQDVLVTNYLMYGKRKGNEDMVTGFFIDNIDSYIIFVEGRNDNFCRELMWSQVQNLNEPICKIFYNSDYIFSKRVYKNFKSVGGFLKIILRYPLQDIFKIGHVFLERNVPKPCLQALRKLDILMTTQTYKTANQYCLFPTSQELISLNTEFGVALKVR